MKKALQAVLIILLVSQSVHPVFSVADETLAEWYWPLWRHDDGEARPVKHLSRGYSSKHHALDIAPSFSDEIVEVRATRDGVVSVTYEGCNNEDGYYNGPCTKAKMGCQPVRKVLKGYDDKGKPIINVTEDNFHKSSKSSQNGYCNVGLGNAVGITHEDGMGSLYAHMSSIIVSVGDKVHQGDVIGYAGSMGYSTGRHLHFAIFRTEKDLLSRNDAVNSNPASPDLKITLADDETMAGSYDGYCYDEKGLEYVFEITSSHPSIVLPDKKITLKPGETYQIEATVLNEESALPSWLSYDSDDPTIVSVTWKGLVKAIMPGEALITVSYGEERETLKVEVIEEQKEPPVEADPEAETLMMKIIVFLHRLFGK